MFENEKMREVPIDNEHQDDKRFDMLGFIMSWEGGELDEEEEVDGFQHLIDNGMAWSLQGCYGRRAADLIRSGLCHV